MPGFLPYRVGYAFMSMIGPCLDLHKERFRYICFMFTSGCRVSWPASSPDGPCV